MSLTDRIAARMIARLDAAVAAADAEAAGAGMLIHAHSRWGRTYVDYRMPRLRAARIAGCDHVPVHLNTADCPRIGAAPARKAA